MNDGLTYDEVKSLWATHKNDPEDTVIKYTLSNGKEVEILVRYLKYLNEYVVSLEEK